MADRNNLTGAIYELRDSKGSARRARPQRTSSPPEDDSNLDERPRSFDTFYAFGVALLCLAMLVQLVAIVTYF